MVVNLLAMQETGFDPQGILKKGMATCVQYSCLRIGHDEGACGLASPWCLCESEGTEGLTLYSYFAGIRALTWSALHKVISLNDVRALNCSGMLNNTHYSPVRRKCSVNACHYSDPHFSGDKVKA